jgi:diphthine synthase
LTATTHQELRIDAMRRGYQVEIINSGSIFVSAAGFAGLQHYKFGRTTTLAFPEGDYLPTSPLEMIKENLDRGLHTLVLLDIKADIGSYMTASEGCSVLLKMEEKAISGAIDGRTPIVAVLRAGRDDGKIVYSTVSDVIGMDTGRPPHCLIVPGNLHFMERELLEMFRE